MLALQARVDPGAMTVKGYFAFPKTLGLLEPHHQIAKYHIQVIHCWALTPQQKCSLVGSIPGHVISKSLKMVLDTSFFNTQQHKVRIKGKVEQSSERRSAFPYTLMQ